MLYSVHWNIMTLRVSNNSGKPRKATAPLHSTKPALLARTHLSEPQPSLLLSKRTSRMLHNLTLSSVLVVICSCWKTTANLIQRLIFNRRVELMKNSGHEFLRLLESTLWHRILLSWIRTHTRHIRMGKWLQLVYIAADFSIVNI